MALGCLYTMEIQLAKKKKKVCQMVFGLQKIDILFFGNFF